MFVVDQSVSGVVLIRVERLFSRADLRPLRLLLSDLVEKGECRRVILDFCQCEHVYYRLTDLLAMMQRRIHRKNGRLILAGMNPYLKDIFTVLGFEDGFENTRNVSEALGDVAC